ncbi:hypothetical protein BS47DRAFT_1200993 [Hydnum rufescens UP504]|uniref:Uncharacterized protein n=1 Tax=Hydnum rufescens UP504 TaxID=1448309 RepID=A0A9P6DUX1_9AGAM|nr:hypothetical protein BS47DRAFT_1200993 [Hydnum rufescens UP504]
MSGTSRRALGKIRLLTPPQIMPTWDPSDNAPRHRKSDGPSPKLNVASGRNFRTPLPDLRFEQSYLKSIAPYLHVLLPPSNPIAGERVGDGSTAGHATTTGEHSALDLIGTPSIYGVPISIRWSGVVWVTVRDQIINPFIQGVVWYAQLKYSPCHKYRK